MHVLPLVASAAWIFVCVAATADAQIAAPQTPPGRFLADWLEAHNSRDSLGFDRVKRLAPDLRLPVPLGQGAGFVLDRVYGSDSRHVEFLLRDRGAPGQWFGVIAAAPRDSLRIVSFTLSAIPTGRSASDLLVSPERRAHVLEGVIEAVRQYHVLSAVGQRTADSLRVRVAAGAYREIAAGRFLADALTTDLREASGDRHLRVDFSVPVLPLDFEAPPTPAQEEARRLQLRRSNCTFLRAERLDGNIGVLKFNGFAAPKHCAATVVAALSFVNATEALIIDLRDNSGGDPEMVTLLSSYFFQSRTRLATMVARDSSTLQDVWTDATLPGRFADDVPVYILTSRRTLSAGEAFAYQLQMLKRATVVGEVTAGAARPSRPRRVDDHFFAPRSTVRSVAVSRGVDGAFSVRFTRVRVGR